MNQKVVSKLSCFAVWMHHAHEGVVTAIPQKIAEIEYRISSAELNPREVDAGNAG
jgi:hypothetical protein